MEEFNADCKGATDLPNDGTNNETKQKIAESIGPCLCICQNKTKDYLEYSEKKWLMMSNTKMLSMHSTNTMAQPLNHVFKKYSKC